MTPDTQREHFRTLLTQLRNGLQSGNLVTTLAAVENALEHFDRTYVPTAKVVQLSEHRDQMVVLLDNGEVWVRTLRGWDKVSLPEVCTHTPSEIDQDLETIVRHIGLGVGEYHRVAEDIREGQPTDFPALDDPDPKMQTHLRSAREQEVRLLQKRLDKWPPGERQDTWIGFELPPHLQELLRERGYHVRVAEAQTRTGNKVKFTHVSLDPLPEKEGTEK